MEFFDVLVQWKNGTKNVVSSRELKTVKSGVISIGSKVKMFYNKKWYYGKVIDLETLVSEVMENSLSQKDFIAPIKVPEQEKVTDIIDFQEESFDSEDNIPLINLINQPNLPMSNIETTHFIELQNVQPIDIINEKEHSKPIEFSNNSDSPTDDSTEDPTVTCEVKTCKKEVFSACPYCQILLCFEHLNEDLRNCEHGRNNPGKRYIEKFEIKLVSKIFFSEFFIMHNEQEIDVDQTSDRSNLNLGVAFDIGKHKFTCLM